MSDREGNNIDKETYMLQVTTRRKINVSISLFLFGKNAHDNGTGGSSGYNNSGTFMCHCLL